MYWRDIVVGIHIFLVASIEEDRWQVATPNSERIGAKTSDKRGDQII